MEKSINLNRIAQDYIKTMVQSVKGIKGIILDKDTQIIFSLVTSKSYAINEEIFMFENIEKLGENQNYNINAIFFIRPTEHNLKILKAILKNMVFKEIYISKLNLI
jgi:hypothetical protein